MAAKKAVQAPTAQTAQQGTSERKKWIKLTPRDHVLKQIEAEQALVRQLRDQLTKEVKTLEGMEKAKEFFPN